MSKLDELLQNIFEYKNLLSFLNKNHPEVLQEWDIVTELNFGVGGARDPQPKSNTCIIDDTTTIPTKRELSYNE